MDTIPLFRKAGCAAVLLICICLVPGTVSAGDLFSYQTTEQTYSLALYTDIHAIEQSQDGGYIIGGLASDENDNHTAFVMRTDQEGKVLWSQIYPGEFMISIKELEDGRIVAASFDELLQPGKSYAPITGSGYLSLIEQDGSVIWMDELTGAMPRQIQITDDTIILVGWSWIPGENSEILEGFLYRYDLSGTRLDAITYEGVSVHDILPTDDGGYVLVGSSGASLGEDAPIFGHLTKIESNGHPEWTEFFEELAFFSIAEMNGGYIMAGSSMPYGTSLGQARVIGVGTDGTLLWNETLQGYAAYGIAPFGDEYLIAGGTGPGNPYLAYITSDGVLKDSQRLLDADGRFTAVLPISDDRVAVGGWSRHTGDVEGWFMIFDPNAEPVTPQPTLPVPVPTTGQPEPTKSPGFGILAAALGMTAAALLAYKRRRD
ncbi:PGF-CTERM sorting domain-containing protein [Methanocalculus sp. MC3]